MISLLRAPHFINWSYTYKCNFSCGHCYSRSPTYPAELDERAYADFTSQLIDAGVFRVGFGGGEPLIRRDFLKTLARLGNSSVFTYFTTNGWYLTDRVAVELRDANVGMVSVSLDAGHSAMHDRIRGQPGSFEVALTALRRLVGLNIKSVITFTVHKLNVDECGNIVDLAAQMGVPEVNIKLFRTAGNGAILKGEFEMSSEERSRALKFILSNTDHPKVKVSSYGNAAGDSCACGDTTLTLRPNGDLLICPYSNAVVGNLAQQSLSRIWLSSALLVERRKHSEECLGERAPEWPMLTAVPAKRAELYASKVEANWNEST